MEWGGTLKLASFGGSAAGGPLKPGGDGPTAAKPASPALACREVPCAEPEIATSPVREIPRSSYLCAA